MSELDIPKLPPDALQLFDDPRLAGMADPLPGFSEERTLTPANPPAVGDSSFVLMQPTYERRGGKVNWINKPADGSHRMLGRGRGLAGFQQDRPRLEENLKKPKKVPDCWPYLTWFVASPRFVEIMSRFDPGAIETAAIDWVFSDGQQLDGYVFLDIRRLSDAYDYQRTAVVFAREHGKTYLARLLYPRALKSTIDTAAHVFRDGYYRTDVFVSRALAKEIAAAGLSGIYFEDPASLGALQFES
jgi:hypothetical protein